MGAVTTGAYIWGIQKTAVLVVLKDQNDRSALCIPVILGRPAQEITAVKSRFAQYTHNKLGKKIAARSLPTNIMRIYHIVYPLIHSSVIYIVA